MLDECVCTDQDWVNSLESRDSRKSVCSSWGFSLSIKAVLDTAHTDVHIYGQKHTQTHGGWAHAHKRISTHVGYWYLWLRTWSGTHIDTHTPVFLGLLVVPLCFIWQLIPREAPLCIHLRSPQHRHPVNTHSQGERRRRWPRSKHAHWHHQPANKDTLTKVAHVFQATNESALSIF